MEYALAQLVMSFGVTPAALAGHSIGELVAATLAGVFDLPAAIKVVSIRARLMHAAPAGAMVAVASNPDDIAVHMTADVDLAAINESGNCVVAGPEEAIRLSPIALPLKASWPAASEPRTLSIRSRWIRCSPRSPNSCPP